MRFLARCRVFMSLPERGSLAFFSKEASNPSGLDSREARDYSCCCFDSELPMTPVKYKLNKHSAVDLLFPVETVWLRRLSAAVVAFK